MVKFIINFRFQFSLTITATAQVWHDTLWIRNDKIRVLFHASVFTYQPLWEKNTNEFNFHIIWKMSGDNMWQSIKSYTITSTDGYNNFIDSIYPWIISRDLHELNKQHETFLVKHVRYPNFMMPEAHVLWYHVYVIIRCQKKKNLLSFGRLLYCLLPSFV